jgi:hypothetical protein
VDRHLSTFTAHLLYFFGQEAKTIGPSGFEPLTSCTPSISVAASLFGLIYRAKPYFTGFSWDCKSRQRISLADIAKGYFWPKG